MARVYLADKDTLDSVNNKVGTANDAASATPGSLFAGIKQLISIISNHVAAWTSARANKIDKLDLVQTTLNTPNGDTLAAWIRNISDSASAANSNAANAANLASQANSNAYAAYQEAVNAKNAAGGSAVKSVQRGIIVVNSEQQSATISAVNVNKAIVLYTGRKLEGVMYQDNFPGHLTLTSSTQVTAARPTVTGALNPTQFPWQVIEFY